MIFLCNRNPSTNSRKFDSDFLNPYKKTRIFRFTNKKIKKFLSIQFVSFPLEISFFANFQPAQICIHFLQSRPHFSNRVKLFYSRTMFSVLIYPSFDFVCVFNSKVHIDLYYISIQPNRCWYNSWSDTNLASNIIMYCIVRTSHSTPMYIEFLLKTKYNHTSFELFDLFLCFFRLLLHCFLCRLTNRVIVENSNIKIVEQWHSIFWCCRCCCWPPFSLDKPINGMIYT